MKEEEDQNRKQEYVVKTTYRMEHPHCNKDNLLINERKLGR